MMIRMMRMRWSGWWFRCDDSHHDEMMKCVRRCHQHYDHQRLRRYGNFHSCSRKYCYAHLHHRDCRQSHRFRGHQWWRWGPPMPVMWWITPTSWTPSTRAKWRWSVSRTTCCRLNTPPRTCARTCLNGSLVGSVVMIKKTSIIRRWCVFSFSSCGSFPVGNIWGTQKPGTPRHWWFPTTPNTIGWLGMQLWTASFVLRN